MTAYKILLAPGDGIGPEIMEEALKVLHAISERFDLRFDFDEEPVGAAAIERFGVALREEGLERAGAADVVLFGAVGDPRYDDPDAEIRPEQAILRLRKGLGLFANLRPVKVYPSMLDDSPLRPEVAQGIDIMVIRELTGGIYFGKPRRRWKDDEGRQAVDTMHYSESEVERILHAAFQAARKRRMHVTSVDKANVLATSRLWREVAEEMAAGYPDVAFENMLVDACAMHLIKNPSRFDVIVTSNLFGDILTDESAMLSGSLGMMPSASLGIRRSDGTGCGLFEPIHGSAPDIAGKSRANPIGMILSCAMMLRLSLGLVQEAAAIEAAVEVVIRDGFRTPDIAAKGAKSITTAQMGDEVAGRV